MTSAIAGMMTTIITIGPITAGIIAGAVTSVVAGIGAIGTGTGRIIAATIAGITTTTELLSGTAV